MLGWQTGATGTVDSGYVGHGKSVGVPKESAAWIARGVRYRSPAPEVPPDETLKVLRRGSIIV
jgi:hypothetical protein